MKHLLSRVFIVLLFGIIIYANEKASFGNNITTNPQSILTEKPSFNLRIACENTRFAIFLNGMEVFGSYTGLPTHLDFPVNDFITNRNNKLSLIVLPTEKGNILNKDTKCNVTLFVREYNNFNAPPQDILTIAYDQNKKNVLENTTPEGKYDSNNNFQKSDSGDVVIKNVSNEFYKKSLLLERDGRNISIHFSFSSSLPRWKFLDSETILPKSFHDLSAEEYEKIRKNNPKIKQLYEINHKIYMLAKEKNLEGLNKFFKERHQELDAAYYSHNTEKEFLEEIKKDMNNPKKKLLNWSEDEWKNHKLYYIVEKNNKVAFIKQVLQWDDTEFSGASRYKIKFRYENGKWILTR